VELGSATVVVTGAGGGIGRALAEGFLADGAHVVAVDLASASDGLDALAARGALVVIADVSDPEAVQGFVDTAVRETGRLDVLVNNAGIGVQRTIEAAGPDEFERVLRVNLFGPFYGLRAALPVMRRQGFGRVINVISRHAEFNPAGLSGYSSSKAALWSLTRTAAQETRGSGVLVNALIPGPTKTGLNPAATQEPEAVYPTARLLATLPDDGPSGRCFWNLEEYRMYERRMPGA
jgi:NAD(P)-dependent dehydrogenase (short-subunit alcohol dehydrogenase family)